MQKTEVFSPMTPRPYGSGEIDAVTRALNNGRLSVVFGRETMRFEAEFARFTGKQYAVATSSGTSALELAFHGLGIGYGDEVIAPAYTFAASAVAAMRNMALIRLADIDPATWNISLETIRPLVTTRTKAILVVHMFGNPVDMPEIVAFARERGLYVIEDCAQAAGAMIDGRQVGSFGDAGCFSFNEIKNLTTGEGGMLVTDNAGVGERGRLLRLHGTQNGLVYDLAGKCTMTEMEAALGRVQLGKLAAMNERRREASTLLRHGLARIPGLSAQATPEGGVHAYSRFVLRVDPQEAGLNRDELRAILNEEGFMLAPVYPAPLYKHPVFAALAAGDVPPGLALTYRRIYGEHELFREYREQFAVHTEAFCSQQLGFIVPENAEDRDFELLLAALERAVRRRKG
ncbi:DegT/DnrJ/EryC1/StrS family aminotransferase [Paenibacillus athensensis]|uniref:DegT/DnrJ/EryC1/StrS family aminotransferase n=1 Tax=Paenibacillus athensensis TaxID=1967502 RepID=A0A4Y8Q7E7_9BACL|nr:DegT/DnrJ/EryC1/StrS family aminotransferase [Paenibacillus athensensis]MCD1257287.1 DegT/DnrJ/EryC1/StrS family aminotransferase [Paenibacillus athensensis]